MPHNGEAEIFTGYCLPYVDDDGEVDHRDQLTLCRTVDVLLEMLFEFTNPGIRVSALLIEVNTLPATLVCTSPTLPRRSSMTRTCDPRFWKPSVTYPLNNALTNCSRSKNSRPIISLNLVQSEMRTPR